MENGKLKIENGGIKNNSPKRKRKGLLELRKAMNTSKHYRGVIDNTVTQTTSNNHVANACMLVIG